MNHIRATVVSVLVLVVALSLMVSSFGCSDNDGKLPVADTVSPTVTPVSGQPLMHGHAEYDMASIGYMQSEFVVEGTAAYYTPTVPMTKRTSTARSSSSGST